MEFSLIRICDSSVDDYHNNDPVSQIREGSQVKKNPTKLAS